MNKIKKYIKNPKLILLYLMHMKLFNYIPDKLFLKIKYRLLMGKKLNLLNPQTFNEKLQWLKLYDRKNIYTTMVDKYEAKKYVADIIGKEYIIPTLGIYDKFNDINFDELPNQFVIKCTHDSGGISICRNKMDFDIERTRKKINKCLRKNYYYIGREWPYKNIEPRIIIEKYMEDEKNKSIRDYKFFCFNGEPKIMYISEGLENHATARMSFYDMDFKLVSCKRRDYKLLEYTPERPKTFEEMKEFAAILSKNIPHLRVDFYEINVKLYFGELTFFTCDGMISFEDEDWNKLLGSYIDIKNE